MDGYAVHFDWFYGLCLWMEVMDSYAVHFDWFYDLCSWIKVVDSYAVHFVFNHFTVVSVLFCGLKKAISLKICIVLSVS